MLDLKKFKLKDSDLEAGQSIQIERVSNKDIAIIGMACRYAKADHPEEFWASLRQGLDLIGPLPTRRKADTDAYLAGLGIDISQIEYSEVAYLDDIDTFDPAFFKISPKEASLMDPNQRIFLMTAWKAVEDAGYGGKRLAGTETGIYLGFSNDFGYEYKRFVAELEPGSNAVSTAGNIKSIIASRIAYIMDLKGPSMVVDTACSSSLTAIHLACTALRNGECDMALAGSVKTHLITVKGGEDGIGILSSIGRARTFDESSDGTGSGEGCGVLMLKPLKKALEDRDAVYAVIKGSAVNQDGSSIGITAPNSLAQAAVIEKAWKDAGIDPETVTYIEAHGTGTKLGDPIEIDGVTRAFRKYTRKNQFCGIGSVKTNLGHLDHAAGIAGIMKMILALQHRELPPSLHFRNPNPKIDFANSPVYVVDSLREWQTVPETPRRGGVSAFGLSGTNTHIILEEAPAKAHLPGEERKGPQIFTISAMSANGLERLADTYRTFFARQSSLSVTSLCCTANTGRGHYAHRAAFIVKDPADCREKLNGFAVEGPHPAGVYYGEARVKKEEECRELSDLANAKLKELAGQAEPDLRLLEELARLYVQGADVEWEELYREVKVKRINLPTYPFEQKRCWLSYDHIPRLAMAEAAAARVLHPLLESIAEESAGRVVYRTDFSPEKHWVLLEHKVSDNYVIPGVTYLEMAREAGRKFYPEGILRLKDVIFISPLIVNAGEIKEVQTVVVNQGEYLEYSVVSEDGLIKHAEAKIYQEPVPAANPRLNLAEVKAKQKEHHTFEYSAANVSSGPIVTGPRWRNLREVFVSDDEVLAYLELDGMYEGDLEEYNLHPALMDKAVNVASQHVGQGLYLPFSYKDMKIYGPVSKAMYSYIRKRPLNPHLETISFDLTLLDASGQVIAEVEHYTVKKVHAVGEKFKDLASRGSMYYQTRWIGSTQPETEVTLRDGAILLFKDRAGYGDGLANELREKGRTVITVEPGAEYSRTAEGSYILGATEADYCQLAEDLKERDLAAILHLSTLGERAATELAELAEQEERSLMSLFHLTRALINEKIAKDLPLVLISDQAHPVTGEDGAANPLHAAYLALGKVIGQEYSALQVKCLDLDHSTDRQVIFREIGTGPQLVAYRQGQRFVQEFDKVEMETLPGRELAFDESGVYLITGGTGGLGLEMARYLADQAQVKIALLNRSPLPERSEWSGILGANTDLRLCRKLRVIQEMEAKGAAVDVISADVANLSEMTAVIAGLKRRYGRIRGVIHGAGVAGDGFILRKEDASFHAVLDPKIRGTWILDHLTRGDTPDFFVLMSSINAIIGGQGQSDYTAANTYLDVYAAMRYLQGQRMMSINWPGWTEVGMAADHGVQGGIFGMVTPSRGIELFAEILRKEIHHVVVGEINYNLIAQNEVSLPFALSAGLQAAVKNRRHRLQTAAPKVQQSQKVHEVVIRGREEAEYNESEMIVARLWAEVLGLETVDVYENFYDLGGDSILATQLLKKMEQVFPGLVDISDIFTYSTVNAMAEYIEEKMAKKAIPFQKSQAAGVQKPDEMVIDLDDLDSILDQLESGVLTVAEAEKLTVRRENE